MAPDASLLRAACVVSGNDITDDILQESLNDPSTASSTWSPPHREVPAATTRYYPTRPRKRSSYPSRPPPSYSPSLTHVASSSGLCGASRPHLLFTSAHKSTRAHALTPRAPHRQQHCHAPSHPPGTVEQSPRHVHRIRARTRYPFSPLSLHRTTPYRTHDRKCGSDPALAPHPLSSITTQAPDAQAMRSSYIRLRARPPDIMTLALGHGRRGCGGIRGLCILREWRTSRRLLLLLLLPLMAQCPPRFQVREKAWRGGEDDEGGYSRAKEDVLARRSAHRSTRRPPASASASYQHARTQHARTLCVSSCPSPSAHAHPPSHLRCTHTPGGFERCVLPHAGRAWASAHARAKTVQLCGAVRNRDPRISVPDVSDFFCAMAIWDASSCCASGETTARERRRGGLGVPIEHAQLFLFPDALPAVLESTVPDTDVHVATPHSLPRRTRRRLVFRDSDGRGGGHPRRPSY
ncbi:hypothetical protein C8R47DRAFT_1227342 [Mycena vitilis]|nr:hypothetical protein C8R47DRAFT_1227342 [Mycena vitilis]